MVIGVRNANWGKDIFARRSGRGNKIITVGCLSGTSVEIIVCDQGRCKAYWYD